MVSSDERVSQNVGAVHQPEKCGLFTGAPPARRMSGSSIWTWPVRLLTEVTELAASHSKCAKVATRSP